MASLSLQTRILSTLFLFAVLLAIPIGLDDFFNLGAGQIISDQTGIPYWRAVALTYVLAGLGALVLWMWLPRSVKRNVWKKARKSF